MPLRILYSSFKGSAESSIRGPLRVNVRFVGVQWFRDLGVFGG